MSEDTKAVSRKPLSSKVQLPKDAYVVRVIGEKFAPSKGSGNDMITLDLEIVHPEIVKDNQGNEIECGGHKFKTNFHSLTSSDKKTQDWQRENLSKLWEAMGKSTEDVDWKNPPLYFKQGVDEGKPIELDVVLYGKKSVSMNAQGKPILLGGKELTEFQVQVDTWGGVSSVDTSNRVF